MSTEVITVKLDSNTNSIVFSNDGVNFVPCSNFKTSVKVNDSVLWQLAEYSPTSSIQGITETGGSNIFSSHANLQNGSYVAVVLNNATGKETYTLNLTINGTVYNADPELDVQDDDDGN